MSSGLMLWYTITTATITVSSHTGRDTCHEHTLLS